MVLSMLAARTRAAVSPTSRSLSRLFPAPQRTTPAVLLPVDATTVVASSPFRSFSKAPHNKRLLYPKQGAQTPDGYIPPNKYTYWDITFKRPHGVRPANPYDTQRLAVLLTKTEYFANFNEDPDYVEYCLQHPHTYAALLRSWPKAKEPHEYLVFTYRHRQIGFLEVDARGEVPWLKNFGVDAKWQGKGLGRELLRVAEVLLTKEWKDMNIVDNKSLSILVRQDNEVALGLLQSAGYQETAAAVETRKREWRKKKVQVPFATFTKQLDEAVTEPYRYVNENMELEQAS